MTIPATIPPNLKKQIDTATANGEDINMQIRPINNGTILEVGTESFGSMEYFFTSTLAAKSILALALLGVTVRDIQDRMGKA